MVSNWYLYVGVFFACTGILTIPGILMIVYWFYKHFMDNGIKVNHVNQQEQYQDKLDKLAQLESRVNEYEEKYIKPLNKVDYIENSNKEKWT